MLALAGLVLLAAVLTRLYTQSVAARYALEDAATETVDLNGADARMIEQLPGIGATLARRIVTERESHGPFRGFDDLRARVDGLGPRSELALDGLVCFGR